MDDPKLTRELERLFSAACDETLTSEEQAALQAALEGNVELQDSYLAFCRMHADLQQHAQSARSIRAALAGVRQQGTGISSEESGESVVVVPRRRDWLSRHITRKSIGVALFVTAAALLVMATMQVPLFTAHKSNAQSEPAQAVARLIHASQAEWQVATIENPLTKRLELIKPNMKLYAGQRLLLAAGLAKFRFADGAEVMLRGPAEFELRGPAECALDFGKLVAAARTKRSRGFVVETPTSRVTDLSTEFAVSVARDGQTLVHVLKGNVTFGLLAGLHSPLALGQGQTALASREQDAAVVTMSDEFRHDIAQLRRYSIRAESFHNLPDKLPCQPVARDLVAGLVPTSSIKTQMPLNRLTDGLSTPRYGQGADGRVFVDADQPWLLTFDMARASGQNATITSLWQINEIRVFSYNSDARVFQDYDVEVSADGEAWEALGQHIMNGRRGKEFNLPAGQQPDYFHDYSVTRLVQADGAAMTDPVRYVRFRFYGVAEQGNAKNFSRMPGVHHTSLYEIDVLGVAATGEPQQEKTESKGAARQE